MGDELDRALWARPRQNERWWVDHLNSADRVLGRLEGFTGGSLELGAQMEHGGNATLQVVDTGQTISWLSDRARIWYDPGVRGLSPLPMATMLFTSPNESHVSGHRSFEIGMLPMLGLLRHSPAGSYSLAAGANLIDRVLALIREAVPGARIAVETSPLTLPAAKFFEQGMSYLQIINELLGIAGYWSLHVDGTGQFQVQVYDDPGQRRPRMEFERDQYQLHVDDWTYGRDLSSVPNRVKLVQQGTDAGPGMEAIAENRDTASPYSIPSRGGQVFEIQETAEFATQAIGNALAAKKLRDNMAPVGAISASHAILPLEPNDVVTFDGGRRRMRASILRIAYTLHAGSLAQAEWREVFL